MAVSRCPHCDQLLFPDEALAPTCASCGGALPGAAAAAETLAAVPATFPPKPPPPSRTPWLLWAAVVALTVSNGATLAWMIWHGGTNQPAVVPHQNAIADASPPATAAPPSPIKPVNESPKVEEPKPADRPAVPADEPPPAPAPAPPAPPPVAVAPNPPAPFPPPPGLTGLTDIEGLQGRIDWNAAGEVVGLRLGNSDLSDNELCLLQPFASLRELDLDHTLVTDKGLIYLQRLKALRSLSLRGVAVTDAGVAALQQVLPGVKIVR